MENKKLIGLYYWRTFDGHKITVFFCASSGLDYTKDYPYVKNMSVSTTSLFRISQLKFQSDLRSRKWTYLPPQISVFESGAPQILYFGKRFFYPTDEQEIARVEVEQWLMWQMGGFGPMLDKIIILINCT